MLPLYLFPSYNAFFSPAIKLSKAPGRSSGGVLVLVKRELVNIVTEIKHDTDNIICLHFKNVKTTSSNTLTKEFILVSSYVPPVQSPYYDGLTVQNGVHILEHFISTLLL